MALGGLALAVVAAAGLGLASNDGSDGEWGVAPPEKKLDVITMTVDGEVFRVWTPEQNPHQRNFDWLTGPNEDYGFAVGGPGAWTRPELKQEIRDFLAMVDPKTGYIEDD